MNAMRPIWPSARYLSDPNNSQEFHENLEVLQAATSSNFKRSSNAKIQWRPHNNDKKHNQIKTIIN